MKFPHNLVVHILLLYDSDMHHIIILYFAEKVEADVVIIGSGVGGLCCGGLLARYGQDVLVLESHEIPGGAAHSFDIKGYHFDSGPSLFSGLSSRGPQANPLAQVWQSISTESLLNLRRLNLVVQ